MEKVEREGNLCDGLLAYIYMNEYYTFTYTCDTELERDRQYIFGRLHLLERILLVTVAPNLPSQFYFFRSDHRTVKNETNRTDKNGISTF